MLARIPSADLVQTNGFGSALVWVGVDGGLKRGRAGEHAPL